MKGALQYWHKSFLVMRGSGVRGDEALEVGELLSHHGHAIYRSDGQVQSALYFIYWAVIN